MKFHFDFHFYQFEYHIEKLYTQRSAFKMCCKTQ